MSFQRATRRDTNESAATHDGSVSEADGAELLRKIVGGRGLGAHDVAEGIAELIPADRDAVIRAVHARFGNGFALEVEEAMAKPRSTPSVLNLKEHLYRARLGAAGRQEGVIGDAHGISNQDIIMEQLAHAGAYGTLDNRKLADWGYLEAGAVEDPESGFRAVLYAPAEPTDERQAATIRAIHGGAAPPVIAFRGTANRRGVADDANRKGIGTYQFASNQARIKALLGQAGEKAIVTGHSLGGALAQLAATNFPASIARVVTFQAPGVDEDEVEALRAYNEKAGPDDQVKSTHHRAEGDLVHLAGEKLTDGDVYTHESVGIGTGLDHMKFPLARLAAARGSLIPGIQSDDRLVRTTRTDAADEKKGWFPRFAEGARRFLGGVVRDEGMERYVEVWELVEDMLDSGDFSREYILAVIRDSDKLTEVQKLKMRDQVEAW